MSNSNKRRFESISFINNTRRRQVTFSKRKRGILKKAMELSILCGQSIYLSIFDIQS